jgi:hypothetical protein
MWEQIVAWLVELWEGFLTASQEWLFWLLVVGGFLLTWILGALFAHAQLRDSHFLATAWSAIKFALVFSALILGFGSYFLLYNDWAKSLSLALVSLIFSWFIFWFIYKNDTRRISSEEVM